MRQWASIVRCEYIFMALMCSASKVQHTAIPEAISGSAPREKHGSHVSANLTAPSLRQADSSLTKKVHVDASGTTILQVMGDGLDRWGQKHGDSNLRELMTPATATDKPLEKLPFLQSWDSHRAADKLEHLVRAVEVVGMINPTHRLERYFATLGRRELITLVVSSILLVAFVFTLSCACLNRLCKANSSKPYRRLTLPAVICTFRAAPASCLPCTRRALNALPTASDEVYFKDANVEKIVAKRGQDAQKKKPLGDKLAASNTSPKPARKADSFDIYTDCDSEIQSTCSVMESTDVEHSCMSTCGDGDESGDDNESTSAVCRACAELAPAMCRTCQDCADDFEDCADDSPSITALSPSIPETLPSQCSSSSAELSPAISDVLPSSPMPALTGPGEQSDASVSEGSKDADVCTPDSKTPPNESQRMMDRLWSGLATVDLFMDTMAWRRRTSSMDATNIPVPVSPATTPSVDCAEVPVLLSDSGDGI